MGENFMIELKPGMRVRCVNVDGDYFIKKKLVKGAEYCIREVWADFLMFNEIPGRYYVHRFKPIVRVKAGSQTLEDWIPISKMDWIPISKMMGPVLSANLPTGT
jgi:hypothetical protein